MNKWLITCLAFGLTFTALPAYSGSQILRHIQALSRDHYYLHINDPSQPFQTRDIVGGEHENQYHILGFEGDIFTLTIESADGKAGYSLGGKGYDRQKEKQTNIITVHAPDTWITVAVSAYPYDEYTFTVVKQTQ